MAPSAVDHRSSEPYLWADRDDLRTSFTLAMSAMYKAEVPLYGDLVRIVSDINKSTLGNALDPKVLSMRYGDARSTRLDIERHGAIRLGTTLELRTIRRVFAIIGLYPVGYYDLSAAGLPMHATCFRPTSAESLRRNPFRVFTSVLRPELLRDAGARDLALDLLSRRAIFSAELLRLLDMSDTQSGRLTPEQGRRFVAEAMKTFGWHDTAAASHDDYQRLAAEHPILADIACFQSCHINHLTPRTLDITAAQERMVADGLAVKDRIEGPPPRACPILLRQTSFLAVEEPVKFPATAGLPLVTGSHRARFGEIEERGAAVTPAGRRLYDELLDEAMEVAAEHAPGQLKPEQFDQLVEETFEKYPDDWDELRRRDLVYCTFRCTGKSIQAMMTRQDLDGRPRRLETLIRDGVVEAFPVTYEDFLPLSAAGIFQSNLGSGSKTKGLDVAAAPDVDGMEEALGVEIHDSDDLYRRVRSESIAHCAAQLGIEILL